MKIILLVLMAFMAASAEYTCLLNPNRTLDANIESCKLKILQDECEKKGVRLSSATTTKNFSLQSDKIIVRSTCRELNIKVTEATFNKKHDKIFVEYVLIDSSKNSAVEEISMNSWNDLGKTQSNANATIGTENRDDSTTLFNVSVNWQVDSRELKETTKKLKQKLISFMDD